MNLLSLHSRLYAATDGLIGHRLIGVPCLLLRTTGRKSPQVRQGYHRYQAKTSRPIPVVALTPG